MNHLLGNEKIIDLLIKRGANKNHLDATRKTALHDAAFFGNTLNVESLIRNGLDVNALDRNHATPLYAANQQGIE